MNPVVLPTSVTTTSVLPAVGTPIMDAIEKVAKLLSTGRISQGEASAFIQRLVWGPMVELIVKLTPTPLDDIALALVRALVPKQV